MRADTKARMAVSTSTKSACVAGAHPFGTRGAGANAAYASTDTSGPCFSVYFDAETSTRVLSSRSASCMYFSSFVFAPFALGRQNAGPSVFPAAAASRTARTTFSSASSPPLGARLVHVSASLHELFGSIPSRYAKRQ